MAGGVASGGLVDRIVAELHRVVASRLRAGGFRVLFEGVDVGEVASRLRVEPLEACSAAAGDPRVVVVAWGESGCRLLPREADALRAVVTSVPHIDFRVYVVERYALRVYPGCGGGGACLAALEHVVAGLGFSGGQLSLLEEFFRVGARFHPVFRTPWLYQVDAWRGILEALVEGRRASVAVMAGTGEGKTEAFLVPLLMYLLASRAGGGGGRVVLLYPRKALATDQLGRILSLVYLANEVLSRRGLRPLRVAVLDGDTPHSWWKRGSVVAVGRDGRERPVRIDPRCVFGSSRCTRGGEVLVPYRRVRCPRCSLEGRESELVIDEDEVVRLAGRDYRWSRDFIRGELESVKRGSGYIVSSSLVRGAVDAPPRLRCPSCGLTVDYLYLSKSDLAVLEEPDIIVAGIDALGVRLGDPTVNRVFRGVKAVVVDEAHMLTGATGAHHALIVRRLLHENLDENPVLVLSSATISNPDEIAGLVYPGGSETTIIDASSEARYRDRGTVTGYNYYLLILPSESINYDTAATSAAFALLNSRGRVLVFTESRRDAEDAATYVVQRGETTMLAERLEECEGFCLVAVERSSGRLGEELGKWLRDPDWRKTVVAVDDERLRVLKERVERGAGLVPREEVDYHHAGLVLVERRAIEERFKRGDIRLLAATSTLELGIDIGDLDTILLLGFPRVPASFFQRAGRAGRRRGVDTLIVTLLKGSYRDLHYYASVADLLSNPRRYFRVNLNVSGAVDILASHTLMRVLDELAQRGVGYSPATLSTLTLASRLARESLAGLDHSRIVRGFLSGLEGLDVRPMVEAGLRLVELLAGLMERCPSLRLAIAVSAVLAWPPVDRGRAVSLLRGLLPEAEECVRRELERVYGECGVRGVKEYNVVGVLREQRRLIEGLRSVGHEPPREILDAYECVSGRRFAEAALYTAVLEKLEELGRRLERMEMGMDEDIAMVTLDSILSHARRLYILAGVE